MKTRNSRLWLAVFVVGAAAARASGATDLLPPFRVEAGGKVIETDGGNAVPCVMDFDGDGTWDLLVGQFAQGKVRLFQNTGTQSAPKVAAGVYLKAGGSDARVPAG